MAESMPKRRKIQHQAEDNLEAIAGAGHQETQLAKHSAQSKEDKPKNAETNYKKKITADAGMYTTDLLQLQLDELLGDLKKTRNKRLAAARDHLGQLKGAIEALPDRAPLSPEEGERLLRAESKVAVPWPQSRRDKKAKYTVSYRKPTRINVVGSFALDTAFVEKRSIPTVDLSLTVPTELFQDKDYLNYRYFVKRAFYLAAVAAGLSKREDLDLSFAYENHNGSNLQPVIIATPTKAELKSLYRIRILIASGISFADSKTLPAKNCIRVEGADPSDQQATPIYNATVRAESTVEAYLKLLHSTKTVSSGFSQACVLLSVWLRQRGLGSSFVDGGFGADEGSILMALLLHSGGPNGRPLLSKGYNSFQLFKAALQLLASRDLMENPLVFGNVKGLDQIQDERFPLLWDGDRSVNVMYRMSRSSYTALRYWARSSLPAFDAPAGDQLDTLFLRRCDTPEQRFDDVFDVSISTDLPKDSLLIEGVEKNVICSRHAFAVLEEALGSRAMLIDPSVLDTATSWSLGKAQSPRQGMQIRVGLVLNSTQLNRAVDRGPSAEDKAEATRFRRFWGEKSELRRFQDSSIQESLVWDDSGSVAIHRQVVNYICVHQLSSQPRYKALDILARDSSTQGYAYYCLSLFNAMWRSYEGLQDTVRNLERLPLQVRNFLPTAYNIQNDSTGERRIDSMDIALQFEGTGRWPDDLVAIQRTKIAFLAKLQSLLESSRDDVVCHLEQENALHPLVSCAFLNVLLPQTHQLFRIRIFHEREVTLLNEGLRKASTSLERQAYSDALSKYNREFTRSSEHLGAIRRLAIQHHIFLPTVMLFREWCSTHLLTPHISPQLQELLIARIFTQAEPFSAPVNATAGLLRALHFLSKWDWWNEPLIVDLGDLTPQTRQDATTQFEAWRKIDPLLNRTVVFAASSLTSDGTTWSQHSPTKAVASRITALAAAAVSRASIDDLQSGIEDIFSTGTGDYDFIIRLSPSFLATGNLVSKKPVYKNLPSSNLSAGQGSPSDKILEMFIQEVSELYSDSLVLFHDFAERPLVAGVWLPHASRKWKATLDYSSIPQKGEDVDQVAVTVNRNAILNEVARLGGALITDIEVRESD